jgi:3-hydroxyisobutyrate dehydrogenase-like beta-hydroxyacid dehydrogenase
VRSPAAGRELVAAARAHGVDVLDAPVGGGLPAARAGTLQVFVSGDAAVYKTIVEADAVFTYPGHDVRVEWQAARDVVSPGQGG